MKKNRIEGLRRKMLELGGDAIFISNFYNILYFFDFETLAENEREAYGIITKQNMYLLTDARYETKNENYDVCLFEPGKTLTFHIRQIASKENIHTLLFESEDLRYFEFAALKERVAEVTFNPVYKVGETIREIKEEEEVDKVKHACKVTDQCLTDLIPTFKMGQTEKEIAFAIEMYLKKNGHDLAFDPIVAIDSNSAIAHYNTKTGNGLIKDGSVILIDFGAKTEKYLADITRMVFFGKPSDSMVNVYTRLLQVQEETVHYVSQVNELKDVDLYCRAQLKKLGLPDFPHSTGHGVGLQIHENPKVSFASTDKKHDGQVITIEPGVYIPNKYGMRIEDTVVVRSGKAEKLTLFPKKPLIVS